MFNDEILFITLATQPGGRGEHVWTAMTDVVTFHRDHEEIPTNFHSSVCEMFFFFSTFASCLLLIVLFISMLQISVLHHVIRLLLLLLLLGGSLDILAPQHTLTRSYYFYDVQSAGVEVRTQLLFFFFSTALMLAGHVSGTASCVSVMKAFLMQTAWPSVINPRLNRGEKNLSVFSATSSFSKPLTMADAEFV